MDYGSSTIFKDGGGIICGQKGCSHLNYARRCVEDLSEFQKKVDEIRKGEPIFPEELFNPGLNKEGCEIF